MWIMGRVNNQISKNDLQKSAGSLQTVTGSKAETEASNYSI